MACPCRVATEQSGDGAAASSAAGAGRSARGRARSGAGVELCSARSEREDAARETRGAAVRFAEGLAVRGAGAGRGPGGHEAEQVGSARRLRGDELTGVALLSDACRHAREAARRSVGPARLVRSAVERVQIAGPRRDRIGLAAPREHDDERSRERRRREHPSRDSCAPRACSRDKKDGFASIDHPSEARTTAPTLSIDTDARKTL